jgi:hypothetical protein
MHSTNQAFRRFPPALALLLAVSGAIIACGSSADNSGSLTTGGTTSSSSSAKQFKVGDQVKASDTWIVTLTLHTG